MMYNLVLLLFFSINQTVKLNANYLECPYARLQADYGSFLHRPVKSSHSSSYSELTNDEFKLTHSPIKHEILNNLRHHTTNSENMIYKNFLDEFMGTDQTCAVPPDSCNDTTHYSYRSIDGSCNNLEHPGLGMAKSRYGRFLLPKYGNKEYAPTISSIGKPLPNARLLSLNLYGDETHLDEFLTFLFMQFGQVVAHDLSQLSTKGAPDDCCLNVDNKLCYPIALNPHGPISLGSQKSCLGFARAVSDADCKYINNNHYAEKISTVTPFFDMSSIYGNNQKENDKIREFEGGLLKTSFINDRQWLPISMNAEGECGKNNNKCFSVPDRRNQFIPSIIVIHTLLLREHNRIACSLAQLNPGHYSDEKLYQEARKINIAQYQKIIYYDWLPHLIGSTFAYTNRILYYAQEGSYINDYDNSVNPAAFAESSTAALRYGHTQIPGYFSLVSTDRAYNETKRLSDYFEKPENIDFLTYADNFDSLVRGMITQPQKKPDFSIDKEMKHYFNRKIFEEFGGDLKSFDIQRGRDFGLPSYNEFRQYCGISKAYDWLDLVNEIPIEKIDMLEKLYSSLDDIDLTVGGSLERHSPGALLGPTFQCIVGKQFLNSRISDRFFYENENIFSGFSEEQLAEIRKSSISGILCSNGDYIQLIQPNSFIVPSSNNDLRNCNQIPQMDLTKWKL